MEPSNSRGYRCAPPTPPCCCRRPAGPAATGGPGVGQNSCSSASVAVTVQLSTWHTTRLGVAWRVYLVAPPMAMRGRHGSASQVESVLKCGKRVGRQAGGVTT